ncbi:undecaprenyldiphospho-muramoylpentapeptide beta-N-acetylglucosaminyltransferase [Gammaproteobacteria bacterium]|nr:undecaprenyldiphospho-muramoylpentapeptide beta-N-acetylglucosaminyltransferase [Gammaproteobacteria bacterium]
MKKRSIVLVCGGSGGHINPAISLYEELIINDPDLVINFFSDRRGQIYLKELNNVNIKKISSSSPFRANLNSKLFFLIYISIGFIQSIYHLIRTRPRLLICFGGYTTLPSAFAAYLLKIPVIIHEQNSVMGRANRLISHFAKQILLSFKSTENLKQKFEEKVIFSGLPLRDKITTHSLSKNKKENSINILVLGGSQGAKIFTDLIPEAISYLPLKLKNKLKIYQNCIHDDEALLKKKYKKIGVEFDIRGYYSNIGSIMASAEIVISRAGANTIFEICSIGKPSILIPLLNSIDNDQLKNAKFFFDKGACLIFDEDQKNPEALSNMILNLILNKAERAKITEKARKVGRIKSRKLFVKQLDKYLVK